MLKGEFCVLKYSQFFTLFLILYKDKRKEGIEHMESYVRLRFGLKDL